MEYINVLSNPPTFRMKKQLLDVLSALYCGKSLLQARFRTITIISFDLHWVPGIV